MSGGTLTIPSSIFLISHSSSNLFLPDTSFSTLSGAVVVIIGGALKDLFKDDLTLSRDCFDSRPMPESWLELELFLEDSSLVLLTLSRWLSLLVLFDFLLLTPLLPVLLTFLGDPVGEFFSNTVRDNSRLLVCRGNKIITDIVSLLLTWGVLPAPLSAAGPSLGPGDDEEELTLLRCPTPPDLWPVTRVLGLTGEFSVFRLPRLPSPASSCSLDFILTEEMMMMMITCCSERSHVPVSCIHWWLVLTAGTSGCWPGLEIFQTDGRTGERECGWKIKTHPALSSRAAENTGEQLQISSLQWLQNLKSRVEHWLLTPPASDHFEGINHWSQDSVLRTLQHHQPQIVATFLEIYSWHHDRTRIVKNYVFNTHFDADSSVIFVPEKDSLAGLCWRIFEIDCEPCVNKYDQLSAFLCLCQWKYFWWFTPILSSDTILETSLGVPHHDLLKTDNCSYSNVCCTLLTQTGISALSSTTAPSICSSLLMLVNTSLKASENMKNIIEIYYSYACKEWLCL